MSAPDLDAVDDLCRLALVASRLGCRVRLDGVSDELRSVLELAGVEGVLIDPGPQVEPTGGDLP